MIYSDDFIADLAMEEKKLNDRPIVKLTEQQIKVANLYAERSKLDRQMIIDRLEWWEVTIQELMSWILGVKVANG